MDPINKGLLLEELYKRKMKESLALRGSSNPEYMTNALVDPDPTAVGRSMLNYPMYN